MLHATHSNRLPHEWITCFHHALMHVNPLVLKLQFMHSMYANSNSETASVVVQDSGCREIAAIMCYDNTSMTELSVQSLIVHLHGEQQQQIPTTSRLWEPLIYPLFFPSGSLGWGLTMDNYRTADELDDHALTINAPTTQIWHYRARLLREPRFHIFGHLTNEYVVDMFSRDLECRLYYIKTN
jgi:hypothetical protein